MQPLLETRPMLRNCLRMSVPFLLLAGFASAQTNTPQLRPVSDLEDARPSLASSPTAALPSAPAAQAGVIGQVADPGGALIPGAVVLLTDSTGIERTAVTDAEGRFRFSGLLRGSYFIRITAPGFEGYASNPVVVAAEGSHADLRITLAIEADHADVTVTLSRKELANDQIHAEEKQRVLGIFPNFYTSFTPNPAPLDTRQKFALSFRATTDPVAFLTAGLVASGEQLQNTFPEYGSGTLGYARRYGAAYADGFVGKIIGAALLPSVFRQDPRYFYMGTGTVKARTRHALLSAVLARHDTGRWEPNYSHILGNAAAGAISTTYHPASNSAGQLALSNALIGVAGGAAVNLVREFLLKPFTHGIPPPLSAAAALPLGL